MHYCFYFSHSSVEFDASSRALNCLQKGNYVTEKELDGSKKSAKCGGNDLCCCLRYLASDSTLLDVQAWTYWRTPRLIASRSFRPIIDTFD